ncbi:DUF4352 domain-containing protein [Streptomyces sp. Tu 2975]|uniref:hypothetical protein n=1 Tax=Streptomyces sp. Tu 2975 TaxID=2676871 RepID=UPI001356D7E2|nr:hypothetical protein [Streptomyces sp. Tu 2975]QIP84908.1 DUF4352 domain-containing protein [Streptomyces sp. Tu 2975]
MATVLVPALLVGLTACQSTGGAGARPAAGPSAGARAAAAGIGDTADVGGARFGEHLRVSARGFVDPAVAIGKTPRPAAGHRWVGVEIGLANVGGTPHGSPLGRTWVVDDRGKRHPAVRSGELTTGVPLKVRTLTVGEHADGWLVFEVPFGSRAVRLDCTVGGERHSWRL